MERADLGFRGQRGLKRVFDIIVAGSGLVLLSPLMLVLALVIALESKGSVIYKHRRIGLGGKAFDLYKFRSMVRGGDDSGYIAYLQQLIESEKHPDGKGMAYRKMNGDRRVTRVGSFLRNYYLDELPQFWNILTGDMSLVGPRPHVQFEVDHYTDEQRRRLSVKPGATGLWQVAGKADCTFTELISLDLAYIDNWNFWMDLKIIFRTFSLMLRGGEGFWARMTKKIPGMHGIDWALPNTLPAKRKSAALTKEKRAEEELVDVKTTQS
jgi:lipopolysaccharide/colanic/teichoic acid biosynthesis glycosyltransferase